MQKGGPRNRGSRGGPVSFEEQFQSNESNSGVGAATSSPGAGFSDAAVRCCTSSQPIDDSPVRSSHSDGGKCGVGLILQDAANSTYNGYNVSVASLSAGGPAEASNQIQAGDCLIKIDGRDVVGKRTGELAGMLLGPVGSAVSLHMRRGAAWKGGEGKIYTVDLNRRWAAAGLKELPQDY